jgi:hypothetical protein
MTGPEDPGEDPIDVVLSAGELDRAIVALREFLHRSAALEVQAVVDRGDDEPPALVQVPRSAPVEVAEGDRVVHLPHAQALDATPPQLPTLPRMPPVEIDALAGSISAPLGAVPALVDGLLALTQALGGRSVALAFFQTTDDDLPLGIAARTGEPPVLTLGDQQFEIPA